MSSDGRVVAVLGPTNTGKTHLAVERMLGYRSGIIGLPLRLLAREIYDRIVAKRGPKSVALVTGEEKITPPHASYFVCTVEAMPLNRNVEFLAVDEIQLCADPERGHVFTDRLLRARGMSETMFMGADTMRPIIRRLLPDVEFISRPRFSQLTYGGEKKLPRLPRRSAIVTFSTASLYTIAELVRRQRGGAAVVLGALSPRTRNAQVALYQSGEVDYLVATDAIGMGLNMDVDHVAFAATRKFDGAVHRAINPSEMGQIAGRAGRHMNDGTFGTTAGVGPIDPDTVEMVVNHRYDPIERLHWRNHHLHFGSLSGLIGSLRARPRERAFVRSRDADDERALISLSQSPEIADMATAPAALRLLWDVCQIPDFAKASAESHHGLLKRIYGHVMSESGTLPEDWIAGQLERLDRTEGDIDTLSARIAHVRTWTFVSHRSDWLPHAKHWQERARAIEDNLSDALHRALTQRFVDRRSAILMRSLRERHELFSAVTADGDVLVEGQYVGKLRGLRFEPDAAATGPEAQIVRTAANRTLAREIGKRAARAAGAEDGEFSWKEDDRIWWEGAPMARLLAGPHVLQPRVDLLPANHLDGPLRERVRRRVEDWLAKQIEHGLPTLTRLKAHDASGPVRGILYQLVEHLGILQRTTVEELCATLEKAERAELQSLGVRLGYRDLFLKGSQRPDRCRMRARLWQLHHGSSDEVELPPAERASTPLVAPWPPDGLLRAYGFCRFGNLAVRVDILDRLARQAHIAAAKGAFEIDHAMLSLLGCNREELEIVLKDLGYVRLKKKDNDKEQFGYRPRRPRRQRASPQRAESLAGASPFDALSRLGRIKRTAS